MLRNNTTYIYALMGEGKTMIAVHKAKMYQDKGAIILSNIPLNEQYFKNYIFIEQPDQIEPTLEGLPIDVKKYLLLDEVDKWLIARLYKREINIVLAQMYGYTRKNNCDVVSTGHRLKNLDVMIRGITNYFYKPKMTANFELSKEPFIRDYQPNEWFDKWYDRYKYLANELENNDIIYEIYNANGIYIDTRQLKNLKAIARLYDTRSRVKPLM